MKCSFAEVMITTSPSVQCNLWDIVDHILPCHTTQLAREYLHLTMADVQIIQERILQNPSAVTYHCLLKFLQKHNADENMLYEQLKRAGVEQGIIPRACLDYLCKGAFF